jgi:hypothetical protein
MWKDTVVPSFILDKYPCCPLFLCVNRDDWIAMNKGEDRKDKIRYLHCNYTNGKLVSDMNSTECNI